MSNEKWIDEWLKGAAEPARPDSRRRTTDVPQARQLQMILLFESAVTGGRGFPEGARTIRLYQLGAWRTYYETSLVPGPQDEQ